MPKTRPSWGLSHQLQNQVVELEKVGDQEIVTIWNEVTFRRKIDTSRVTVVTTTVQLEQKAPKRVNTEGEDEGEPAKKKKKMVVQNDKEDSETEEEQWFLWKCIYYFI